MDHDDVPSGRYSPAGRSWPFSEPQDILDRRCAAASRAGSSRRRDRLHRATGADRRPLLRRRKASSFGSACRSVGRSIRPGTPLALTLVVSRLSQNACTPLRDVQVDLWQCDHEGVYSDVQDPSFNMRARSF